MTECAAAGELLARRYSCPRPCTRAARRPTLTQNPPAAGSWEVQMSATVAGAMPDHIEEAEAPASTQVGAVSFSDLVRAHYKRERERKRGDAAAADQADDEF